MDWTRRELLAAGARAAVASWMGCGFCARAAAQFPEGASDQGSKPRIFTPDELRSRPPTGKAPQPGGSRRIGCSWRSAGGGPPAVRLSKTTGNVLLDQGMTREWQLLCARYGVTPDLYMFEDGDSPNAFATPDRLGGHSDPDGTVVVGRRLMREEMSAAAPTGGRWDHVVAAIMAHEWAHIAQFKVIDEAPPGKAMELHADQVAGWYMGGRARELAGQVDLVSAMRSFFGKGDYEFNSPQHHGTPRERLAAFERGLAAAQASDSFDEAFDAARGPAGL